MHQGELQLLFGLPENYTVVHAKMGSWHYSQFKGGKLAVIFKQSAVPFFKKIPDSQRAAANCTYSFSGVLDKKDLL